MSSRHKRLSKRIEALISRISSAGLAANRPPHISWPSSAMVGALPRLTAGVTTAPVTSGLRRHRPLDFERADPDLAAHALGEVEVNALLALRRAAPVPVEVGGDP